MSDDSAVTTYRTENDVKTRYGRKDGGLGAVAVDLHRTFAGRVHVPGDELYDDARWAWNRGIDPRPAIVAEADGRDDVRAAVVAAREHELPFAVQGTGHGTLVPSDGGLLLKTSAMAGVQVDPRRRTARVGAGALWSEVIAASAPFGLAPLSGTPSVGVTGYTLGGGAGWLSRAYGFAADSLVRAEVVTADGRMLEVSADEHPGLFWALRGGSGNFAVVTSLELRLYPVARVYAGLSMYDIDRAPETLTRYREWAVEEPDELNTAVMLVRIPDTPETPQPMRGRRVLAIRAFCLGAADEAERLLRPLLEAAGPPLSDGFASMTFAEAGVDDVAAALRPHATGGSFLNFLTDPARTRSAFTAGDHRRLAEAKKAWDPDNFFRLNHNIPPC